MTVDSSIMFGWREWPCSSPALLSRGTRELRVPLRIALAEPTDTRTAIQMPTGTCMSTFDHESTGSLPSLGVGDNQQTPADVIPQLIA